MIWAATDAKNRTPLLWGLPPGGGSAALPLVVFPEQGFILGHGGVGKGETQPLFPNIREFAEKLWLHFSSCREAWVGYWLPFGKSHLPPEKTGSWPSPKWVFDAFYHRALF